MWKRVGIVRAGGVENDHEQGMSNREIAMELGISRNTVRKKLRTTRVNEHPRKKRGSRFESQRDQIRELVEKYNLSAVKIMMEILKQGYYGGYTILKDYCATLREDRRVQSVYRYETDPGKHSHVDFGEFGHIGIDGKRKKLYDFSIILGYSRMRYAEFTTDISTENVIKIHLNSFRFFVGCADTILFDNIKQVALEMKIKTSESVFNRKSRDFHEYYGFIVRLSYPCCPETKENIENSIKYIRYNLWAGRTFESLKDINAQCMQWLKKVNSQIHGTTHQIPMELLAKERLDHLDRIS